MGGFFGVVSKTDCVFDLFFGTDYPMWHPAHEVETFYSLGLSEEDNAMILYRTAQKLFRLEHVE